MNANVCAIRYRSGERVLVPFCGVGPFVIPAAARGAEITAIEQNQEACRWLSENVLLNGVSDQVNDYHGRCFLCFNSPGFHV